MNAAARYGLSTLHRQWGLRLLLAGAGALLFFFVLVLPELKKIRAARETAARLQAEFQAMQADPLLAGQRDRLLTTEADYEKSFRAWSTLRKRYNALPNLDDASAEARIDFKVALQEARERLHEEAIARGYQYPETLGMTETISAEENTETRMRQLQTAIRIAELCMQHEVAHVQSFRPLHPHPRYPPATTNELWAVDYPVEVHISCRYDQLIHLLDALRGKNEFISLYSMTTTHPGPENPDMLAVRLVLGLGRMQVNNPARRVPSSRPPDVAESPFSLEASF